MNNRNTQISAEKKPAFRDLFRDLKEENIPASNQKVLSESKQLGGSDMVSEMAEHKDTSVPVEKVEEEKGSDFDKFMELAEEFHMLQVQLSETEKTLSEAKDERKEFYNSENSLGKTTFSDHRREKSFIAQEIEVGDLLQKMIALRGQIIKDFESVQDKSEREQIYKRIHKEFKDNPDELGLSHEILNFRTQEIFAKNQEKKAALKAWQKEAEKPKVEPEPKMQQAADVVEGGMIPDIQIGEGLESDEGGAEPIVIPTAAEPEGVKPADDTAVPIVEAPAVPVEAAEEKPVSVEAPKREPVSMTTFGPDGSESVQQAPAVEFKEDIISSNIILKPNEAAGTGGQKPKLLSDIEGIKRRMNLPGTPPIRDFEEAGNGSGQPKSEMVEPAQDPAIDKLQEQTPDVIPDAALSPDANPAVEADKDQTPLDIKTAEPPTPIEATPPVDKPETENITPLVGPAVEVPVAQVSAEPVAVEVSAQPQVQGEQTQSPSEAVPEVAPVQPNLAEARAQTAENTGQINFTTEPEKRSWMKGLTGIFKRNPAAAENPVDKHGAVKAIVENKGFDSSHIASALESIKTEEPNGNDQKLAA